MRSGQQRIYLVKSEYHCLFVHIYFCMMLCYVMFVSVTVHMYVCMSAVCTYACVFLAVRIVCGHVVFMRISMSHWLALVFGVPLLSG